MDHFGPGVVSRIRKEAQRGNFSASYMCFSF